MQICKEIDDYIEYVRHGPYAACEDQQLLCNLVEKRFQDEKLILDADQLRRYLAKEKFFPFRLFAWEKFMFALHNCVYTRDGLLRWPTLFMLCGRGTGKNGYASFEAFSWITPVNGVKNYDVDLFAMAEDQARTSFDDVYNVLEDNKARMEKFFKWNMEKITNLATGSRLRYRTSNAKTKDGGRPGAVIFDEYHAYEDYTLVDVATTGLGKKQYPRTSILTTDGYVRGGPLDDMKIQSEDILKHELADNGTLPFICRLDDKAEIDNKAMWYKANPSLQYLPTLRQELEAEYAKYQINPSGASSFKVKRMNLPETFEAESVTDWENILACKRELPPDLEFTDCVAGIDYAKTTDFVSAGLLFLHKENYYWMQHTWICKESKDLPKIKAPLADWEEEGYITYVDGPEIPPDLVAQWLEDRGHEFNITVLGVDNFRITLMSKALQEHGFDCDKNGNNNIRLLKRVTQNRYVPVITSLFNTHRIAWGNDPMMGWYTNNASVESGRDGNQFYSKKDQERRKTDGFMALVAAICAADDLQDSGLESDYGIEFITF